MDRRGISPTAFGRTQDAKHFQGVAFAISDKAYGCLTSWTPVSERLAKIRLKTNHITVSAVAAYAPIEDAPEVEKDCFYRDLASLLDTIPARDMVMLMGDFNAPPDESTDNGIRRTDLCRPRGLQLMNTIFPHCRIHQDTYYPEVKSRSPSIKDYIITDMFHRPCFHDVRVWRGADGGSDHRLLVAVVKIKLKGPRRPTKTLVPDSAVILAGSTIKANPVVEAAWTEVKEIYDDHKLPGPATRPQPPWISDDTWKAIKEKHDTLMMILQHSKDSRVVHLKTHYKELTKKVQQLVRTDKAARWDQWANDLQSAADQNNWRMVWKQIQPLRKKRNGGPPQLVARSGEELSGPAERVERWREHFNSILNVPSAVDLDEVEHNNLLPPPPPLPPATIEALSAPPTLEEVTKIVPTMRMGAAGVVEIPPRTLRPQAQGCTALHKLLLCIWEEEAIPLDWRVAMMIALHKKGLRQVCDNYRGITLLVVASKVYAKVLLRRTPPLWNPDWDKPNVVDRVEVQLMPSLSSGCSFRKPGQHTGLSMWASLIYGRPSTQSTETYCGWHWHVLAFLIN